MTSRRSTSAAVIGGGIAGLSAAYQLQQAGVHVTVYEASNRWGGKIFSSPVGDRLVDAGPDTFLARAHEGVELCAELGLTEELVAPVAPVPAYIQRDQNLHPLPSGTILGIPTDFDAVTKSGLVTTAGLDRARLDLSLPKTPIGDDCSLGWFCRQRLGDEVTERLIDPLLGGINASNIDELSIEAAFPSLAEIARSHRSLIAGLRDRKASVGATLGSATSSSMSKPVPVFHSLPGGMAQLIERLVDRLSHPVADAAPPVDLRLNTPVTDLEAITADGIVLATPSFRTADLLKISHPELSEQLAGIRYTSVTQATFEFAQTVPYPSLDASGILFPRVDGHLATAATWLSTKWNHYATDDRVLIRVSSGRANDTRSETYSDSEVKDHLLADLGTVVNIGQPPCSARIQRWPQAFPQYSPGHRMRIEQIHGALASKPGRPLSVAGAAYDGIGIPACIRSGRQAAQSILRAEQS